MLLTPTFLALTDNRREYDASNLYCSYPVQNTDLDEFMVLSLERTILSPYTDFACAQPFEARTDVTTGTKSLRQDTSDSFSFPKSFCKSEELTKNELAT